MGDLFEFAGVVGVVLVDAMGWQWGTFWIKELELDLGWREALPRAGRRWTP